MFIPQTAEEMVYKIVVGVNYPYTQKLRLENVLGRGATRGEPPLTFLENQEKSLDFGKKRTCLCSSLG